MCRPTEPACLLPTCRLRPPRPNPPQAITLYEELLAAFPSSPYLQCQLAHAKYNLREFDEAQAGFETLLKSDPYRLDQVCARLEHGETMRARLKCTLHVGSSLWWAR